MAYDATVLRRRIAPESADVAVADVRLVRLVEGPAEPLQHAYGAYSPSGGQATPRPPGGGEQVDGIVSGQATARTARHFRRPSRRRAERRPAEQSGTGSRRTRRRARRLHLRPRTGRRPARRPGDRRPPGQGSRVQPGGRPADRDEPGAGPRPGRARASCRCGTTRTAAGGR